AAVHGRARGPGDAAGSRAGRVRVDDPGGAPARAVHRGAVLRLAALGRSSTLAGDDRRGAPHLGALAAPALPRRGPDRRGLDPREASGALPPAPGLSRAGAGGGFGSAAAVTWPIRGWPLARSPRSPPAGVSPARPISAGPSG